MLDCLKHEGYWFFLQLSFHTIDSYISLVTYSILKFLTPPKTRKWPDPFIYSRWSHFSPFIWSIISLACFHLAPPHSFWDGPSLPQRLRVCSMSTQVKTECPWCDKVNKFDKIHHTPFVINFTLYGFNLTSTS